MSTAISRTLAAAIISLAIVPTACLLSASAAPEPAPAPTEIRAVSPSEIPAEIPDEKFSARALLRIEEANLKPITFKGGVRHPIIYFRQVANRKWSSGALFLFILSVGTMLKIFLPGLTGQVIARCRSNSFISLSSAFIYTCVMVAIIRTAFRSDDMAAMGIFSFGLLQFSYAIGACLGANLLAQKLYELLTRKNEPGGNIGRAVLYGACLLLVATVLTFVSLIPNFGRLPRIGNRVVMLVAALGLGGLVNLAAGRQKQVRPESEV